MRPFLIEFTDKGSDYGFEIYAESLEDADRRLGVLKANSRVVGEKFAEFQTRSTWVFGAVFVIGFFIGILWPVGF